MRTLVLALLALPMSPVSAGPYPVEIDDARAAPVVIETKPERIVALSNFAADAMVYFGLKPVGITTYAGKRPVYLGEGVAEAEDLGDITAPNLELLAKLQADLTVGLLHYNGPFAEEIGAIGGFLAFDSSDVAVSKSNVAAFGAALGLSEEAARSNATFDAMRKEIAGQVLGDGPSFLLLWHFHDALYAYQDNLMTAELIAGLGAENLVGYNHEVESAEQAFVPLDPEELLAHDPDYLFVFTSHGGPVKNSPVYDRLSAVRTGKAYSVGYQYSQPGGPIARKMILQEVAHLFYPDLFAKPEMPEAARAVPLAFAK